MTVPTTLYTTPAALNLSKALCRPLGQQARRSLIKTTYAIGLSAQRNFSTSRVARIEVLPPNRDTTHIKETRAAWPHHDVTEEQLNSVEPFVHRNVRSISDRVAFGMVKTLRFWTDLFTGYRHDESKPYIMNERKWLIRFIFLETVAAVPGMTAAMLRHFRSLRRLQRDNGWIETMLEEAYNERMHLLTFIKLAEPGWFMKMMILAAQGVFANGMFLAYLISPATCHRFVGYLEEEATNTYTYAIADIDKGRLPAWSNMRAPDIAIKYWSMPEGHQSMRDLLLYIRADEAKHREVNHTLGNLDQKNDPNPYVSTYVDPSKPHPTVSLKTLKSHGWERHEII